MYMRDEISILLERKRATKDKTVNGHAIFKQHIDVLLSSIFG